MLDNKLIRKLEDIFGGNGTCSIAYPVPNCVTFARNDQILMKYLRGCIISLFVMINHKTFRNLVKSVDSALVFTHVNFPGITFYVAEDLDYEFTLYHNWVNRFTSPHGNLISTRAKIDPSSVIGVEGLHVVVDPDNGKRIQMKHLSSVEIEDNVTIGAGAVIQRGVLNPTVLKKGCYIDVLCNVGHGAQIGEATMVAAGAIIGGSCKIGDRCWIGLNSTIKNGIEICDDVVIGSGSNVYRDIKSPGIWVGNPAVRKGSYDPQKFNF